MQQNGKKIITVGVTGASGAVLAQKMLGLLDADARVERIHLVVTETGLRLFAEELAITPGSTNQLVQRILGHPSQKIEVISNKDVGASIASGSENMMRAQQAGAVIMPAIPSFYHQPKTIDDLVTQYVCRVLAQMELPQDAMFRWTGSAAAKEAKA